MEIRKFFVRSETACAEISAQVFSTRLCERGIPQGEDGFRVVFSHTRGKESGYELSADESGAEVRASDASGFFGGAGALLRRMDFAGGTARLEAFRLSFVPACEIRGAYFASHFHNFYITAPAERRKRYIEDIALMGCNTFMLVFPMINLDREGDAAWESEAEKLAEMFGYARRAGMKNALLLQPNSGYRIYPAEYRAEPVADPYWRRGNTGNMLCYSKAEKLLDGYNENLLRRFRTCGIDMVMTWPYDEGGCGCAECAPWGGNGFVRASRKLFETARKILPGVRRAVSAWAFDSPDGGDWKGLSESLKGEKWADYILADSHEDFPRTILEEGVPGDLPLLNFPEISMWGMFPWGGFGASMFPKRLETLFRQVRGKLAGGFFYSEGIFEDLNKAVVAHFYNTGRADSREAVRAYARYELGLSDASAFLELTDCLEDNHTDAFRSRRVNLQRVARAFDLAREIDASLEEWAKTCWRWRLIAIRAELDFIRFSKIPEVPEDYKVWRELLEDEPRARELCAELAEIYSSLKEDGDDPFHVRVHPII